MPKYTISKSRHAKKGIDVWLIKPIDKLDYSTYKNVESKIKIIGGYYSRFTHSFVFESEPSSEKLNEIFGDTNTISEIAKEHNVSSNKIAKIIVGQGSKVGKVDKRTLRSEYNDKKLLVTRTSYIDGQYDTTRSIPEKDWSWTDRDSGFEREFDYSSSPYVSGIYIQYGDYKAKYKDDIIIPQIIKTSSQKSYNYYIDIDKDTKVNDDDKFQLDRDDSKRKDLTEGQRVILSLYGNKYCGAISKKEVSTYTIRSYGSTSEEIKENVRYDVLLDNGVKQSIADFKLDTNNECDEVSIPAIFDRKIESFKMPEQFWSSDIIRNVNHINNLRQQKSQRKKTEYIIADEKNIQRNEKDLFSKMSEWLGWELENLTYARKITGETEEEQNLRIDKFKNEFNIVPAEIVKIGEIRTSDDKKLEREQDAKKLKLEAEKHLEDIGLIFPNEKIKQGYLMLYYHKGQPDKLDYAMSRVADIVQGWLYNRAEDRKLIKQQLIKTLNGSDIPKSKATDAYFTEVLGNWYKNYTDLYKEKIEPKKELLIDKLKKVLELLNK
jgi:hypothetical protein